MIHCLMLYSSGLHHCHNVCKKLQCFRNWFYFCLRQMGSKEIPMLLGPQVKSMSTQGLCRIEFFYILSTLSWKCNSLLRHSYAQPSVVYKYINITNSIEQFLLEHIIQKVPLIMTPSIGKYEPSYLKGTSSHCFPYISIKCQMGPWSWVMSHKQPVTDQCVCMESILSDKECSLIVPL